MKSPLFSLNDRVAVKGNEHVWTVIGIVAHLGYGFNGWEYTLAKPTYGGSVWADRQDVDIKNVKEPQIINEAELMERLKKDKLAKIIKLQDELKKLEDEVDDLNIEIVSKG